MRLAGLYIRLLLSCWFAVSTALAEPMTGSHQCAFNIGNCPITEPGKHRYVQDYGYGGFESYLTTAARYANQSGVANFVRDLLTDDGLVNPQCMLAPVSSSTSTGIARVVRGSGGVATVDETLALQSAGEAGRGYRLVTPDQDAHERIRNMTPEELDRMQEELVFLQSMSNVHQFTECQNGLFRSYFGDETVRREMLENAYAQFRDIRPVMLPIMLREADLSARRASSGSVIATRPGEGCARENCRVPTVQDIETAENMGNISRQIAEDRQVIESLVSRIPMANRDSMRAQMLSLIASSGEVSEAEFNRVFNAEMRRLDHSVTEQLTQIEGITVTNNDRRSYCVDWELKRNLVRSGQVDMTVQSLVGETALRNFSQRAGNRYGVVGEIGTELILIPTYFVGYGFARMGARAGLSTVRAVAMSGRALSTSTRYAMLGLEALDWGTVFAAVARDCHSQTFFSRVEGQQCNPHEEIGQVYEESSMAQCLTSVLLPTVTALVGTSVRLANSRRLNQLYRTNAPPSPVDEIVVTSPSVPRYLSPADARTVEARLRGRSIDLSRPQNITFTAAQVARLTDQEKILVLNRMLGMNLSRERATEILAVLNRRNLSTSQRQAELLRILTRVGFTAEEAQNAVRRVTASHMLGEIPSSAAGNALPQVAPATTSDLNRVALDMNRLGAPTPLASSAVLRSVELPSVNADTLRSMMNRPAYRQLLVSLSPEQQLHAAQALKRFEDSGLSPQQSVALYREFEVSFRMVAQLDHGPGLLAEYIARRRRLGIPNHVIRRRIEEQFPGCGG